MADVIYEGQNYMALGRVLTAQRQAMTQSEVAAIVLYVYDVDSSTPETAIQTVPIAPTNAIFDTLQLDESWKRDAVGYNFRHIVGPGVFTSGASNYRLEYQITFFDPGADDGAAAEMVPAVYEITVSPLYSY